ncbi:MAG: asparagine synthase (glutamine-hydrolyzing) [Oscillospiraceae bacterium]|nr:asparagine synthase (glutamine-hydrolyzing) [Oscillospiraceae bacterium]
MNDTMFLRGPDDSGQEIYSKEGVQVGLAQRRLAIIDLSKQGHQPMHSYDKRISLVFNGEIYNFNELKKQLDYPFVSKCDTEVIIAAYLKWGIDCITRFNGMFSFALFDRQCDTLHLVRDRIGEKPLYYGCFGDTFVFASELKALRQYPGIPFDVDRDTLDLFLKYRYIPAPYSIYKNIYKLTPGHYAVIKLKTPDKPQIYPYWDFVSHCNPTERSEQEVLSDVERLLTAAVRRQMAVDVPFGAFLSGGIDSSLVTALMQSVSPTPVNTYTIGFHEADFNEAEYAKEIAEYLGTNHTEYYVSPKEAMDVIPKLPFLYDEPFADSSQIPTYLVSHLAGKDVKVALTGDGGDEMFCGYTSYTKLNGLHKRLMPYPLWLRKFSGNVILALPSPIIKVAAKVTARGIREESIRRGARVLKNSDSLSMAHEARVLGSAGLVLGANPLPTIWEQKERFAQINDFYKLMMATDALQSLPDDMLVKVDRASMGCSLECRAPLLDTEIIEYAASVPGVFMVKNGSEKWILKEILNKYIPKEMTERPKMGFGIPIGDWIKGPLKPWAEELLSTVKADGFLNSEKTHKLWENHIKGVHAGTYEIWAILMFQAWLRENVV